MPLMAFPLMLGLAILVTFASALYLMLNARSVAELFRHTQIAPGGGRPRQSRAAVLAALVAFNLGWVACIALYWMGWTGSANAVIESPRSDSSQ